MVEWRSKRHVHENLNATTAEGCDVSNSTTDQFKNLAALETSALKQLKMGRARTPALEPPAPAGAPGVRNDQAGDACAYRATATCMQLPHTRARSSCLRSANAPALLGATVAPFPATHGQAGSAGFFLGPWLRLSVVNHCRNEHVVCRMHCRSDTHRVAGCTHLLFFVLR